jgi:hypothetical protein
MIIFPDAKRRQSLCFILPFGLIIGGRGREVADPYPPHLVPSDFNFFWTFK